MGNKLPYEPTPLSHCPMFRHRTVSAQHCTFPVNKVAVDLWSNTIVMAWHVNDLLHRYRSLSIYV